VFGVWPTGRGQSREKKGREEGSSPRLLPPIPESAVDEVPQPIRASDNHFI